ncbi:MAG: hypothetical protein JJT89_06070 [Nitriliruptoraceae bacterium]|nr:hypothetical protein [Nitriliruptoraceae bacterium]
MRVREHSGRSRTTWSFVIVGLLGLMATVPASLASAGTSSQPELVRSFDGAPVSFMPFEQQLYFSTNVSGAKLWRSDGTTAGTGVHFDVRPDDIDSTGRSLVSGGSLYLTADDGQSGVELWRTDGTDTERLADLCPGSCSSFPSGLTEFDGQLYFNAFSTADGLLGRQLHRYDPSTGVAGKVLGVPDPRDLTVLGDHLYLIADRTLQRTDGDTVEVVPVPDGWSRPSDLVRLGSSLFFALRDGDGNEQVFVTDGALTEQLTSISPLPDGTTSVRSLTALGGRLYITLDRGDGTKLWVSDGPTDTPRLLEVLENGISQGPLAAWRFAELDGVAYFNGFNRQTGSQLWRTDGTVAGTRIVEDLGRVRVGTQFGQPTYNDPAPDETTAFGGRLYFSAYVAAEDGAYAEGRHLFRTTPGGEGVEFVAEFGQFRRPTSLTVVGDALFFSADGGLWRIGGTDDAGDDDGPGDDGPGDDGPGDDEGPGDDDDEGPGGDPVAVTVQEAITVSDAVRASGPATVVVSERVTVADAVRASGPASVTVAEPVAVSDAVQLGSLGADGSDPVTAGCDPLVIGEEVVCEVAGLDPDQPVEVLVVVNPTLLDTVIRADADGAARFTFRIPGDLPPGAAINITIRALDGTVLFSSVSPARAGEGAETAVLPRQLSRVGVPASELSARQLSRTGIPALALLVLSVSLLATGFLVRGHGRRARPAGTQDPEATSVEHGTP